MAERSGVDDTVSMVKRTPSREVLVIEADTSRFVRLNANLSPIAGSSVLDTASPGNNFRDVTIDDEGRLIGFYSQQVQRFRFR